MSFRQWFRALRSVAFAALVVSSASLFTTSAISAQAPTTPVNTTSAPQTATVTITNAGMVSSISVVTQGSSTLAYTLYTPTVPVLGSCVTLVPYTPSATCTVQYTFTPTRPFTRYGAITLFDASGNVLGNTFLTGVGTGPQVSFPLNASSALTTLGSGFTTPYGVAVDASGNVYVADSIGNAVKEVLASSGTIVTLGSGFLNPTAVAVDGAGNIYVADTGHNAVKEIVAVNGTIPSPPLILSLASSFTFSNPQGVAVDGSGNVYVADTGNSAVEQIAAVNGVIPSSATAVSLGAAGSFSAPNAVAVDASGNVYVTDSSKASVREIVAAAGMVSATSAVTNVGSGLVTPQGVAVDGSGNVYVSDLGNKAVKEFLAAGGLVILGSGYTSPTGVAVDSSGDVFVADGATNNAVEELNAQTPPSLSFGSTVLGSTSTDSPKTFTLLNIGNAPLSFPSAGAGSNPAISASFSVGAGNTCPQVASGAAAGSLAAGASCVDSVSFTPVMSGAITGSLTATDTNLNATAATQIISLSGIATPGTPSVTVTSPSATVNATTVTLSASVAYAGVAPAGPVTFSVNSGAPVTASCTGSASPLSCTATYNPSSLTVASYTITATIAADTNYLTASGNGTLFITQGTPTISLGSGASSAVDASVTFTATVTPSSGITPVGPVSFSTTLNGTTTVLCATATLTAGSASCQTTALMFGANSITATLAGDTNFTSVTSAAITQTVSAATTSLTISSPGSATVDSAVALTATLSATAPFTVTPPGTVSFAANGTPIPGCAAQPVSASTHAAICSATALVTPSDSITATYTSGSNNFSGSNASAFAQSMTKDTTSAAIVSTLPTSAVVDQTVTFTATITPTNASAQGVTPTGSVIFTNGTGGPTLCSGPVVLSPGANGTGVASCATAFGAAMSSTNITAVYTGDTNFLAANLATVSQVVLAAATTTTLTSSPNPAAVNATVTLTLTVVPANSGSNFPGTTLPNGSIAVFDTGVSTTTPICSYPVSNGRVGACSTPVIFATSGTHTLSAIFTPNDSNFRASTSATYAQTVNTSSVTLTVSNAGSTSLTVNQSATFAATFPAFTAGQTIPSGTVAYYDSLVSSTVPISGCSALSVSGTGTIPNCTETLLAAGTHLISATFTPTGTSSFQTTYSNQLPQVVAQSATTVVLTAPTGSSTTDQVVTFTATITPSTTGPGTTLPTGTIAFTAISGGQTSSLCTATLAVAGATTASCTAPFTAAATYSMSAKYTGDTNFVGNTSTARNQVVGLTGTTLGLTSANVASPAQPAVNQSATYSVQLTLANSISDSGLTTPSGSIVLKDSANSAITCSALVASNGQASCALTEVTAGSHSIVATYTQDANFGGSTMTFPVTILQSATSIAAASIVTTPSSPSVDQTGVVLNATVTPTYAGATIPSGNVVFTDSGNGTTCTSTLVNGIVPGCPHVFASSGSHTITAVYNGDTNFSGVTQSNTVTVGTSGSTTITVNTSTPTITINQVGTFTATFSAPPAGGSLPSGGTVAYLDNGVVISTCNGLAVSSAGAIANCMETLTSAGTHQITVQYTPPANSSFPAITSGAFAQSVAKNSTAVTITAPAASSTDSVDQLVTFSASIAPSVLTPAATGTVLPTGTVTFTYSGVPPGSSTPTVGPICSALVSATATASCPNFSFSFPGTYTITATYTGDTNFNAPAGQTTNLTVGKTGTTLIIYPAGSPPSTPLNVPAVFTPVLTTAIPDNGVGQVLPTGTVTILDTTGGNSTLICTTGIVNGVITACPAYIFTTSGTHTLTANYAGDSNFSAAPAVTQTVVVPAGTTGLAIVSSSPTSIATQAVTFTATLSPTVAGSTSPTAAITFSFTPSLPTTAGTLATCPGVLTQKSGVETATCTVTPTNAASGTYAVGVSAVADVNYSAPTSQSTTQIVQNFTPVATVTPSSTVTTANPRGEVILTQGIGTWQNTNVTDPYFPTQIVYTATALAGFPDTTGLASCSFPGAPAGLTCVPEATPTSATGVALITATSGATAGLYQLTLTFADARVPTLTQTVTIPVLILAPDYASGSLPYSVPTAGVAALSFTLPSSLAGSTYTCNAKVAKLDPSGSGKYLQFGDTLTSLNLKCSSITAASAANTYSLTVQGGSGAFASLEPSPIRPSLNRILAAGLFAPLLLAAGFSRRTKKVRKALLRNLGIVLMTLIALQLTVGCGGGFTGASPGSTATVGSYLIGISNAQGVTVSEIPLVVAGNQ